MLAVATFGAATIGFLWLLAALSSLGTSWLGEKSAAQARSVTSKLFLVTTFVYLILVATAMVARRRGKKDEPVNTDESSQGDPA